MHELSWGYTSNNLTFGAVHNPYDLGRVPGGSSGGSAAAVAARIACLSVAEDTEGSIRVPAALCGVAGFRPTTGRYQTEGVMPDTPVMDQLGPHARWAADLALFDTVLSGDSRHLEAPSLKGVRLGVVRSFWAELDPELEQIAQRALERLRAAGVEVVESDRPPFRDLPRLIELVTDPIQTYDFRWTMSRYLRKYGAGVTLDQLVAQASPEIRGKVQAALPGGSDFVTECAYRPALNEHLPVLRAHFRAYFKETSTSAIVFPTTVVPAPRIGQNSVRVGNREVPLGTAMSRNIASGSTVGLPGLVLPAGLTTIGLPVALEFDGPQGTDRKLLALASSLEQALGRLPPPRA